MTYLVLVAKAQLPSRRVWDEALRARGFDVHLDVDFDFATHQGFLPCRLGAHASGFELSVADEENADIDDELMGHMTGRDAAVVFVARNDLQNVAVMIAGAVLTQLSAGLFCPEHTGDVFDAREALEMARRDWEDLVGAAAPQGAAARIRIPFAALGFPDDAPQPVRYALELSEDADLADLVGGLVSNGATFSRTDQGLPVAPVAGGLFDESTFGPLGRFPDGSVWLPDASGVHPLDAPQGRAFGRIQLPRPIPSPWITRYLPEQLASAPASTTLPVLPAGLRPIFYRDGVLQRAGQTTLYAQLVDCCARYARLVELGAPPDVLDTQVTFLETYVRAIVLDGAACFPSHDPDGEWSYDASDIAGRCAAGDVPIERIQPIHDFLTRFAGPALGWIETQLGERDALLSIERWPHGMYLFRALLAAAGIEIVPLRGDGTVDGARLQAARDARYVDLTSEVHERLLPHGGDVWHPTEAHEGLPHVDVYSYGTDVGMLLLTGGASRRRMTDDAGDAYPFVELASLLPIGTGAAERDAMCRTLWRIAVIALRRGLPLAPGHTLTLDWMDPGATFELLHWRDVPWAHIGPELGRALPRQPQLLVVVPRQRVGEATFPSLLPPELRAAIAAWQVHPGASDAAIARVERDLGVALPPELAAYYRSTNGSEGTLGETWLGLVPVEDIANLTDDHELADSAPDYVLFGTNGGAEGFAFDRRSGAVVVMPLHEPEPEAIVVQGSFVQFLQRVREDKQFDA